LTQGRCFAEVLWANKVLDYPMMASLEMAAISKKKDSAMKRIILNMAMAIAAVTVAGCSKEEMKSSPSTGMTLTANVSEPTTKATISDEWKFSFAQGDVVKATNSTLTGTYYTFTKGTSDFASTDAQTTTTQATWYAFYPGESITLTSQDGTKDGAANHFGYAGQQADVAAHTKTLSIAMSPKMAIIEVVNYKGSISLSAKTSEGKYITGMTASTSGPSFTVATSDTESALLTVTETGTYYIAVPAGVAFDIYDGTAKLKSIAADKLVAGKHYTLTIKADWFYFEAVAAGATVSMAAVSSAPAVSLQYSIDGGANWNTFTVGTTQVTLANVGDKVYFKATTTNKTFSSLRTLEKYNKFTATANVKVGGNIMYLLDGTTPGSSFPKNSNSNFFRFFYGGNKITSASDLRLPATTLTLYCYAEMFYGCTALVDAPDLPATTLAANCYESMFRGCTALAKAPALEATTLANNCCDSMFRGCTALAKAPALEATTLANACYNSMFVGCSKLSSVTMLATNVSAAACLSNWLGDAGTDGSVTSRTVYVASGMVDDVKATVPDSWKTGVQVK